MLSVVSNEVYLIYHVTRWCKNDIEVKPFVVVEKRNDILPLIQSYKKTGLFSQSEFITERERQNPTNEIPMSYWTFDTLAFLTNKKGT